MQIPPAGVSFPDTFVLGGTTSLSVGGLVNLGPTHTTLLDLSQVSLTVTANSLIILPPGTSTSRFKSFSNPNGLT